MLPLRLETVYSCILKTKVLLIGRISDMFFMWLGCALRRRCRLFRFIRSLCVWFHERKSILYPLPSQAVGNRHAALRCGIQKCVYTANVVGSIHWRPLRCAAGRLPTAWVVVGCVQEMQS